MLYMADSLVFETHPVKIMTSPTTGFVDSTICVKNNSIFWESSETQGTMRIVDIFKDMQQEKGLLVADEAYECLPEEPKKSANPELLIHLTTESSSAFILFENWDVFEDWVNGKL